jgi:hypothetical protein
MSLTALAVVLIVLLPGERLNQNRSGRITISGSMSRLLNGESARMAIVKQTLTTSSTFFVGWAFVVFFRDLAAVTGSTSIKIASSLQIEGRTDYTSFLGALCGVLLFGPVLSFAVLSAKAALLDRFATFGADGRDGRGTAAAASATFGEVREDMLRLQRAAVRARLARMGVIDRSVINRHASIDATAGFGPRMAGLAAAQAAEREPEREREREWERERELQREGWGRDALTA